VEEESTTKIGGKMLLLDFDNWKQEDIPVVSEMFKDERCPCYKNECFITPMCTDTCEEMNNYSVINISETLAYLRDRLRASYYKRIDTDAHRFIRSSLIFKALVDMQYKLDMEQEIIFDEWVCITNRYIFTIKRSVEIAKNMQRISNDDSKLEYFFIGM
jgi:hypothetical protein